MNNKNHNTDNSEDTQLLERLLAKSQRSDRRANAARAKQKRLNWEVVDTSSDSDSWDYVDTSSDARRSA